MSGTIHPAAPTSLASLRDAESLRDNGPVVSLRSTTGYKLASLRDGWQRHRTREAGGFR